MKEEQILITIEDGNVTVEVKGVAGKKCVALTKELEEALGTVSERTFKREYYSPKARTRIVQKSE